MAKMKTFAVTIEYTVRETLHVEARRPNGAAEQALTSDAYNTASRTPVRYRTEPWPRGRP